MTASAKRKREPASPTGLLARLAEAPAGLPLFPAKKGEAALFLSRSESAEQAARSLAERGWIAFWKEPDATPVARLTRKGWQTLVEDRSAQGLLRELIHSMERRQVDWTTALEATQAAWNQVASQLDAIRTLVTDSPVLTQRSNEAAVLLEALAIHGTQPGAVACPLPELFDALIAAFPTTSIGQFHDLLRSLRGEGLVRLTPWTGGLAELPRPELAFLIGHEVLYYAVLG